MHMHFPRAHWSRLHSTNPLERVNRELKRRLRVVGIFPDRASAIRLAGAVLLEVHEELDCWSALLQSGVHGDRHGQGKDLISAGSEGGNGVDNA